MASNPLDGKSILVTGGTGSFGRAFTETLIQSGCSFSRLVIYSRDEQKQFDMQQDVTDPRLRFFIGDVRDRHRLTMAMRGVDVVIHAAALKHVPAAEYNPMECIKTNIYGAENVIFAAMDNNVQKVMALSTDKAAHPTNLYGATKLCSDKLFVAGNNIMGAAVTSFAVTRYGNVLGSRGSVLPFFRKLIKQGADSLPITDQRMTRFNLTLAEGIQFVIDNLARMQGGETFVSKIPSFHVTDLAKAIAPHLPLKYIGIRPGEKLHEVMCTVDDAGHMLEFDDHFVILPSIVFNRTIDYSKNALGQKGRPVAENFEYNSGNNPHFLTLDEIKAAVASVS